MKPKEIILNPDEVKQGFGKECLHYVPICESFKALVEDKSFNEVMDGLRNENGSKSTLDDVKDGAAIKTNHFFKENPGAFSLLVYSDALEVANPLGAGRLKHKIVQVFWSISDLPRLHRSQIDKLQLGLVFREKLLKKYSLDKIFKHFVDDLKLLESGIAVEKPVARTVKAGLLAYSADNLEAHIIGGFSPCFSSRDICRFCHLKYKNLCTNIHNFAAENAHKPWTVEEYDIIVNGFDKSADDIGFEETTRDNLFTEFDEPAEDDELEESEEESDQDEENEEEDTTDNYGLKTECVFNKLAAFHCVTSMPPDCLHDLFEGVLAQDLLGIIRILKDKRWFSLEDYNAALKQFPLSSQEASNKPQLVPSKNSVKKLPGKAVSVWCHMRFFLPIIYQNNWILDAEDSVLELAILLTEITQRITAERFEEYEIDVLEEVVIKYLDLRKLVLEENPCLGTPKPKHHFICHYGENIRKFGPPLGFWTGRYESKHRVAKAIAESSKNFKNISLTVATRQQLRMASI